MKVQRNVIADRNLTLEKLEFGDVFTFYKIALSVDRIISFNRQLFQKFTITKWTIYWNWYFRQSTGLCSTKEKQDGRRYNSGHSIFTLEILWKEYINITSQALRTCSQWLASGMITLFFYFGARSYFWTEFHGYIHSLLCRTNSKSTNLFQSEWN